MIQLNKNTFNLFGNLNDVKNNFDIYNCQKIINYKNLGQLKS